MAKEITFKFTDEDAEEAFELIRRLHEEEEQENDEEDD
jgi:hypothetical protein|tara:strand:- start:2546 stop:2659 length:114 start_codon:yes stop_codon:yes gene_type:complete